VETMLRYSNYADTVHASPLLRTPRLPKPEDGQQTLVDPPELLGTCMPNVISEAIDVDRADLFDENLRRLALDQELRPET
jgi:hypothetical protein